MKIENYNTITRQHMSSLTMLAGRKMTRDVIIIGQAAA
jgi:hypothetical protein